MRITGAKVYGPGESGVVGDIHIEGGRIVPASGGPVFDASGCIAVAGGIDIHSHPLALSRLASLTGKLAEWGDLQKNARQFLNAGFTFFVEAGLMESPAPGPEMDFAWLGLNETAGGSARKFIGPKGVEEFFKTPEGTVAHHVHLPHLARGNGLATLEGFLNKLEGRRCHLSHVSHYAFAEKNGALIPAGEKAARLLEQFPNVTFDCGPVVFGPALTFTADTELALRVASGRGLVAHEGSPFAAVPYMFQKGRRIDALLWLNAMELLLSVEDISRMALSIDFPSGGRIDGYPEIFRCLMDKPYRDRVLASLEPSAVSAGPLGGIARELTIKEVIALTRENPARIMGLAERGHLRPGAVADVVLYAEGKLFSRPKHVIRHGALIELV